MPRDADGAQNGPRERTTEEARHFEVARAPVCRAPPAIQSRRQRPRADMLPAVLVEFAELPDHEVSRAPVRAVSVPAERGARDRLELRLAEHEARVELVRQHLEHDP